jgi:hypothetical protein
VAQFKLTSESQVKRMEKTSPRLAAGHNGNGNGHKVQALPVRKLQRV